MATQGQDSTAAVPNINQNKNRAKDSREKGIEVDANFLGKIQ